jgi:hypothetical protein
MTSEEFKAACLIWEDTQKVIGAAKVQRWDVVKWTVGLNVAIATAAVFSKAAGLAFLFSIVVAAIGLMLVAHYFWRLTNARSDAEYVVGYLQGQQVNVAAMTRPPGQGAPSGESLWYDWQELLAFPRRPGHRGLHHVHSAADDSRRVAPSGRRVPRHRGPSTQDRTGHGAASATRHFKYSCG